MPSDPAFTDLRTDRLVIRRFRVDDAAAFAGYRGDPEVARYQSWEAYTLHDALAFIAETAALHPGMPGEWYQFAVADPSTDELLGDVALRVDADDVSRAELGFTMSPHHQGKGYATEAVTRVIAYAFERLGVETAFAIADARNDASIALLERIRMRRTTTEHVRFKSEWCDEHTFELRRDEA
jgi:RimJ/RimL family protein N-acetyltransferase